MLILSDFYANSWQAFAGEMGLFGFDKSNDAVFGSMNGEIARHVSARTGNFGGASLANENFAVFDFLSAEALDAEALTGIVVNIFGGTASFYV